MTEQGKAFVRPTKVSNRGELSTGSGAVHVATARALYGSIASLRHPVLLHYLGNEEGVPRV